MKKPNKRKNYRRCVSCRQVKDKSHFLRVVRTYPQAEICIEKGMGRSAYICPQSECLVVAQKQKRLSKALRTQIGDHIYEQMWQILSLKFNSEK